MKETSNYCQIWGFGKGNLKDRRPNFDRFKIELRWCLSSNILEFRNIFREEFDTLGDFEKTKMDNWRAAMFPLSNIGIKTSCFGLTQSWISWWISTRPWCIDRGYSYPLKKGKKTNKEKEKEKENQQRIPIDFIYSKYLKSTQVNWKCSALNISL